MSFKGDLSTIGLAEVFQMISMAGKEGTLIVQDAESRKSIFFGGDGVQLLSTGKRKGLRLGDLLVRAGKLSEYRLKEVLETQKATKKLLGESLIESGYVTQQDIQDVVRAQIEEEIYDLFLWKKASFEFVEGPPPPELQDADARATKLSFDVNGLLLEAVRRVDEWNVINSKIPGIDCVIAFPSEVVREEESGRAPENVRRLFPCVDGQSTIAEVLDACGVTRFDGCRTIADLVERGRMRILPVEEVLQLAELRAADGRREKGLALLRAAASLAPTNADLAVRHARFLESGGQNAAAAAEFVRAGSLLADAGRDAEARGFFQHALELQPEDARAKDAITRIGLGEKPALADHEPIRQALASKDYARAHELCEGFLRERPDDPECRLLLIRLFKETGQRKALDEQVRYLRSNLPSDLDEASRIRKKLGEIAPENVTPRGLARIAIRRRRRRIIAAVSLLLILAAAGAVAKFEWDAREVFEQHALRADLRARDRDYARALQALEEFRRTPYRWSPSVRRRLEEKESAIREARDQEAATNATAIDVQRRKLEELVGERLKAVEKEFDDGNYRQALSTVENLIFSLQRVREEDYVKSSPDFLGKVDGFQEQARQARKKIEEVLDRIRDLRREADNHAAQGRFKDAVPLYKKLVERYPRHFSLDDIAFPLRIRARPDGTVVSDHRGLELPVVKDGKVAMQREPVVKDGEIVLRLPHRELPLQLRFFKRGYKERAHVSVPYDAGETAEIVLDEKLGASAAWPWTPFEKGVEWTAVFAGDAVGVASGQSLYFISAGSASLLWRVPRAKPISGAPVEHGGKVYYLTGEKALYVADPAQRKETKIALAREGIGSPGIDPDGRLAAIGTSDRYLTVLDLQAGGAVKWERLIPARVAGVPIVRGDAVFWLDVDGVLHAANEERELWTFGSGHVATHPVFAAGRLYLGLKERRLVALDLSGREVWSAATRASPEAAPVVADGTVYAALPDGSLQAFPQGGGTGWTWPADGRAAKPIRSGPAVAQGKVLLVAEDALVALDAATGRLLWTFRPPDAPGFRASPLVAGRTVYVGGADRCLYAVELD